MLQHQERRIGVGDPPASCWIKRHILEGMRVMPVHAVEEALGERAAETRGNYTGGWRTVFTERYGAYCAGA